MALSFTQASSQYLTVSSAVKTGTPFTFVGWYNTADNTTDQTIFSLNNATQGWDLVLRGSQAGDPIRFRAVDAGATSINSSTGFSINAWEHVVAVATSSTSRDLYLNGNNVGNSTTSRTPSTPTQTQLGAGNAAVFHNGLLAECALYDVALSTDKITMLSLGYSPLLVEPESLLAYWPLIGQFSPETDIIGNFDLTLTNSPTQANHNRIIVPVGMHLHERKIINVLKSVPVQACTFSIPTATFSGSANINAPVKSVVFTTQAPTVTTVRNANFSAPVKSVVASIPAHTTSGSANITPTAKSAIFSTQAPSISAIRNVNITPTAKSIVASIPAHTTSGSANISPTVKNITASTQAPTVTAIRNVNFSAPVESIVASIPAHTTSGSANINPTVKSAIFTTQAPSITTVRNVNITPTAKSATFSTQAPSISTGGSVSFSAPVKSLTFSTQAPSVTTVRNVSFSAPVKSIVANLIDPVVTAIRNVNITPSVKSAIFSTQAPSITTTKSVNITPSVKTLVFSIQEPTITLLGSALFNAPVKSLTFSLPPPVVSTNLTLGNIFISDRTLNRDFGDSSFDRGFQIKTKLRDFTL